MLIFDMDIDEVRYILDENDLALGMEMLDDIVLERGGNFTGSNSKRNVILSRLKDVCLKSIERDKKNRK